MGHWSAYMNKPNLYRSPMDCGDSLGTKTSNSGLLELASHCDLFTLSQLVCTISYLRNSAFTLETENKII